MNFLANLTLQKRISLLVFLSLTLGLALFSVLGVQSLNESTQRALDERLTISRIVASHVDETMYHSLIHLKDVANSQDGLLTDTEFREIAKILVNMLAELNMNSKGVFLLDSNGKIVQQLYQYEAVGQVLPGYAEVENLIASGKPAVSSLVYAPLTTTPVVEAMAPVQDSDDRYIGALSVAIDINSSSIAGFIKPIILGNTGYVEIVDRNGVVLARTEPGRRPAAFEMSDHPGKFAQLMAEGKAAVRTCHRCHETENQIERRRDVLAFAPLSFAPWGVAVRQSEEEAFAITEQLKKRLFLFGGIIVISMFLIVWIFMQGVVRPIKQLTSAAARVANGDFKAVVPIKRRDEIGQLSSAFAIMTHELDRTQHELLSRNRELLALNSVASTVSQSLDLEEILTKAIQKVLEVTNSKSGWAFLNDVRKKELKLVSYTGSSNMFRCLQSASPANICACHQVVKFGNALFVNDVSQCPLLGEEVARREEISCFVSVPLKSKDKVLGVICVSRPLEEYYTERDLELMHSIGQHVGLAVENSILYQETRRKEELRGQLLSTIIDAQEEERKRISRELHDGCAQTLTGLIMSIESAENMTVSQASPVARKLASTRIIATHVLEDMRKLMRGLRSTDLEELGLVTAIHSNAQTNLDAEDIHLDFDAQGFNHALPPPIETALFRIVQEAVHNIIKHSHAQNVIIRMNMADSKIVATISDDGRGFDTSAFFAPGRRSQSLGLIGMHERANLLGGALNITSTMGQGTLIAVEIPIDTPIGGKGILDE